MVKDGSSSDDAADNVEQAPALPPYGDNSALERINIRKGLDCFRHHIYDVATDVPELNSAHYQDPPQLLHLPHDVSTISFYT